MPFRAAKCHNVCMTNKQRHVISSAGACMHLNRMTLRLFFTLPSRGLLSLRVQVYITGRLFVHLSIRGRYRCVYTLYH